MRDAGLHPYDKIAGFIMRLNHQTLTEIVPRATSRGAVFSYP